MRTYERVLMELTKTANVKQSRLISEFPRSDIGILEHKGCIELVRYINDDARIIVSAVGYSYLNDKQEARRKFWRGAFTNFFSGVATGVVLTLFSMWITDII